MSSRYAERNHDHPGAVDGPRGKAAARSPAHEFAHLRRSPRCRRTHRLRVGESRPAHDTVAGHPSDPGHRPGSGRRCRPARFAQLLSDTAAVTAPGDAAAPTANELQPASWQGSSWNGGDEHEALELGRRVAATDVGTETLGRLENMVDKLAIKYPVTPPQELLEPVRRHVSYVARLLDARKTLDEHHRLLVVGGWLSLLAATLNIDLERRNTVASWLATATSLARETGQDEIHAWRYETEVWQLLTDGDYRRAAELSQAAQQFAPRGSSAAIDHADPPGSPTRVHQAAAAKVTSRRR